jgi:hypothetical protein
MTSGTIPEDVKIYLDAVRARLDDLPDNEREDLLADVEPSILESAEEGDMPVELRLGAPDAFADELRAAAGLPPRVQPTLAASPLRRHLADAYAAFADGPRTRWLRDLAPLWWVLRALVVVALVDLFVGGSVFDEPDNVVLLVALATVLAVVASIAIGLRRPRRNAATVLVNLALALATVPVLIAGAEGLGDDGIAAAQDPFAPAVPDGLTYYGNAVQNIYAFDRRGRLLQDVRLYDQFGVPLEIGARVRDPNRRQVRTRGGDPVFNAFPIRYFEPGTRKVAHPAAGAPEDPDPVVTKPLQPR